MKETRRAALEYRFCPHCVAAAAVSVLRIGLALGFHFHVSHVTSRRDVTSSDDVTPVTADQRGARYALRQRCGQLSGRHLQHHLTPPAANGACNTAHVRYARSATRHFIPSALPCPTLPSASHTRSLSPPSPGSVRRAPLHSAPLLAVHLPHSRNHGPVMHCDENGTELSPNQTHKRHSNSSNRIIERSHNVKHLS